uniref:Uncharacterized protein n=1 Tax=Magnetococcus massalia (strain MO-1) TaxID=451514 RepID=A0A1S7LM78_MAGMO|nr:conserved protein of unknown function [Candidatus Magnetococcus massalia]
MNLGKALNRLESLLDAKKSKQRTQCDEMQEVLKKLKKREKTLQDELAKEKGEKQKKRLEKDLRVLQSHWKKADKLCRSLKQS